MRAVVNLSAFLPAGDKLMWKKVRQRHLLYQTVCLIGIAKKVVQATEKELFVPAGPTLYKLHEVVAGKSLGIAISVIDYIRSGGQHRPKSLTGGGFGR